MKGMLCLRCEGVEVEPTSQSAASQGEVQFFRCPACGRRFRMTCRGALVERWPGPLGMVLYPVIFDEQPQDRARQMADELYAASQPREESLFGSLTIDQLQAIRSEVQLELQHPTQEMREILGAGATEADLREYLALVAGRLNALVDGKRA